MATQFPGELDSLLNPQPTDSVAAVSHASQHTNANDAIEALQIKVGKDNSTDVNSIDYYLRQLSATKTYADDAASAAQAAAQLYADGLSINYDPAGSASAALIDANEYTDFAVASLGNSLPNVYVPLSAVGNIDGVASLDPNGKVPLSELDITETIQDVAAGMITGGTHTNISVSYNNNTGTLSFTASGGGGGGASVIISPNPPSTPGTGDIWLDSDNGKTYIWDGAYWIEVGGSSSQAVAAVNSIPPANPILGSIWMNSSTAKTYIYDGSFWAQI